MQDFSTTNERKEGKKLIMTGMLKKHTFTLTTGQTVVVVGAAAAAAGNGIKLY